jgi:molybdate transport system regulatory protein
MGGLRLTLRVDFGPDRAIGPGKVVLLEAIRDTGSISQAGRSLGMSYRRAWLLVDDMNRCFREPVVTAQPGGSQGGGAALTAFGEQLIQKFRTIETQATAAAKPQLRDLEASLRSSARVTYKPRKTSIRASTARR